MSIGKHIHIYTYTHTCGYNVVFMVNGNGGFYTYVDR
jgi:hypothetical protein